MYDPAKGGDPLTGKMVQVGVKFEDEKLSDGQPESVEEEEEEELE